MELGEEALEELYNHPFVCMDPGRKNDAGVVALAATKQADGTTLVQGKKHLFVSDMRYKMTGVDALIDDPELKPDAQDMKALSQRHGRKRDAESYKTFTGVFRDKGNNIRKLNRDPRVLRKKRWMKNRTRSYWCSMVSMILALASSIVDYKCDLEGRAPIIVFGNPTFKASAKRQRSGAPKKLLRYLKRFFTVVVIGEYNTSKLCPRCQGELDLIDPKGTRMWKCPSCRSHCEKPLYGVGGERNAATLFGLNPEFPPREWPPPVIEHPFIVNKDISAALNMFHIFYHLIATGERPAAFSPKKTVAETTLQGVGTKATD